MREMVVKFAPARFGRKPAGDAKKQIAQIFS